MKKAYRIKKKEEFQHVLNVGKSFANRQLVIYYIRKPTQEHFRIGISVGKKLGNAVLRNRIKRLLREAFKELESEILPTLDIIIIARQPTVSMDYHQIKSSLMHLLKKEKLLKTKK